MADVLHGGTIANGAMPADVYALIDTATVSNIVAADITDDTITNVKLKTITAAGKVTGAAITALASIPSGAGVVPPANLGTGSSITTKHLKGDGTWEQLAVATAASEAEMEAGTENAKAVTPAVAKHNKGVAKGWCTFDGSGATGAKSALDSYNVSGISKTGTGDYTISWDTDFSNEYYAVIANSATEGNKISIITKAAGTTRIYCNGASDAKEDTVVNIVAFGVL